MKELKIKSDTQILVGDNIREIRKSKNIGQTELVRLLDLQGITITPGVISENRTGYTAHLCISIKRN